MGDASTWVHRLSDIDPGTKTGTCANCGRVRLKYRRHRNQWACYEATKQWRVSPSTRDAVAARAAHLRAYSLTTADFKAMLERQGGRCAICRRPMDRPHVDHDHQCCPQRMRSCGECVRGLLCRRCNLGIGYFGDDPQILWSAVIYVTQ